MDKLNFANPSYDRNTGKAEWSTIYFGSYPQEEVKDNGLVPTIVQAVYNKDGDALVDGIKYRRIKQDDTFRYFRWDKIKWRVLWNDGDTIFVIADRGLDCKAFDNKNEDVAWEHSYLRRWLADDFYNIAFNRSEQEAIITHEVENITAVSGGYTGKDGSNNTYDKIYVPSIGELRTSAYGFYDEKVYWEHKINKKINRRFKPTSYAQACGVWVCDASKLAWYGTKPDSSLEGNCCWWTRSPCGDTKYGSKIKHNAKVTESGDIDKYYYGHLLHRCLGNAVAVVPVMNLDLNKLTNLEI